MEQEERPRRDVIREYLFYIINCILAVRSHTHTTSIKATIGLRIIWSIFTLHQYWILGFHFFSVRFQIYLSVLNNAKFVRLFIQSFIHDSFVHFLVSWYLGSSGIQMCASGHTLTPSCSVICQFFSFFPGNVHVLEISFDDVQPVFPRVPWLSLVTYQLPLYWTVSLCWDLQILSRA